MNEISPHRILRKSLRKKKKENIHELLESWHAAAANAEYEPYFSKCSGERTLKSAISLLSSFGLLLAKWSVVFAKMKICKFYFVRAIINKGFCYCASSFSSSHIKFPSDPIPSINSVAAPRLGIRISAFPVMSGTTDGFQSITP